MPIRITTTLNDSNQVKKVEYDYDSDVIDNVTAERDYDYGNGAPGTLLRRTSVSWLKTNPINNVNYLSLNILNRKVSDSVYDSLSDTCNGQPRHVLKPCMSMTITRRGCLQAALCNIQQHTMRAQDIRCAAT
jgi:hypothetical protein